MPLVGRKLTSVLAAGGLSAGGGIVGMPGRAPGQGWGETVVAAVGETSSAIGTRCGGFAGALIRTKPLLPSPNFLVPGLPCGLPQQISRPDQASGARYVVRPGETIASIARSYSVPMSEMFRLNPDIDARTLRAGDVILVPGGKAPQAPA